MFAESKTILAPLVCLILCAVIMESGQLLPQEAECLRLCRLAKDEGLKTGVQVSKCYKCLHSSKDHVSNRQRKRKSLSPQPSDRCPSSSPGQLEEWIPSKVNVTFGQYINTNHWYLNCSWTSMNDPHGQWNGILIQLSVGHPVNFITPVSCYELSKNQTFFSVNISSLYYRHPDPIYLTVIGLPLMTDVLNISKYCPPNTITSSPIVTPSSTRDYSTGGSAHLTAGPPNTITSSPIVTPSSNRDHSTGGSAHLTAGPSNTITSSPISTSSSTGDHSTGGTATESNNTVAYAVSISTGTLVGLVLVVVLLLYLYWRWKKSIIMIQLPSDFQYHAFIMYNNEDRLWMKNKLLPFLEDKNHLTCCIHYRDFIVGKPFRDNMAESVYNSHKVIALFSSNFVKSNYCKYELDLAIGRLVAHRDRSLVVIRIDGVDFKLLPSELREHSIIDYNDPLEKPFWKQRLLNFLGLPADFETHTTNGKGNFGNNNSNTYVHMNGNTTITGFSRLNSTTSNDSEISYV